MAYWLKDSIIIENNKEHIFKNTKSIPDSLTVSNVIIFCINVLTLMIRKGLGTGLKKVLKNIFDTFNFKKQNEMLKKRHMSQYELNKLIKNQDISKQKQVSQKRSYKSSTFIFWALILITIIIQISLIPYMK
ncbi:hypothetical protein [Mycoplasma miroungirhinis]|uniref:Uncharacterized protein n=1 Tax=Mycoplasma miroungirhinis TaxID=754516 RepID=A0A6M4JAM0_9MOLU|nr:hypothetical protein [Mycoplasma miroungirhinis]QJR43950.1 hypothetical protein HLA92_00610 [Mycoplasma miroungirhinis]